MRQDCDQTCRDWQTKSEWTILIKSTSEIGKKKSKLKEEDQSMSISSSPCYNSNGLHSDYQKCHQ